MDNSLWLVLHNLVNPISKLRYSCVNSRLILLCTSNAPRNDASQHVTTILSHNWHGSSTVPLVVDIRTNFQQRISSNVRIRIFVFGFQFNITWVLFCLFYSYALNVIVSRKKAKLIWKGSLEGNVWTREHLYEISSLYILGWSNKGKIKGFGHFALFSGFTYQKSRSRL